MAADRSSLLEEIECVDGYAEEINERELKRRRTAIWASSEEDIFKISD